MAINRGTANTAQITQALAIPQRQSTSTPSTPTAHQLAPPAAASRVDVQLSTSHNGRPGPTVRFAGIETGQSYTFQTGSTIATLTVTPAVTPSSSPNPAAYLVAGNIRQPTAEPPQHFTIDLSTPPPPPEEGLSVVIHSEIPPERRDSYEPIPDPTPPSVASDPSPRNDDDYIITIVDRSRPVDPESGLNEESSLLGHENQSGCTWASHGLANVAYKYLAAPAISGIRYAKEHPVVTITSLATASTPALTALANPAGITPDQIGAEWWNDMSLLTKIHSVVNCGSSLSINAIMNAFFLPTFWEDFRKKITHSLDSPGDFLDNSLAILLGLGGGIAQAAIAYNSFLWLPAGAYVAGIPAVISFSVTLASRYIGVKNMFRQIHNLFNEDAKVQAEFADALEHIDEKYLSEIQLKFSNIAANIPNRRRQKRVELTAHYQEIANRRGNRPGTPLDAFEQSELTKALADYPDNDTAALTNKEFEDIEVEIASHMKAMLAQHPDLIKDKTTCEFLTKYSLTIFKISLASIFFAAPYFLTYMQKGFDGISTLAKFAGTDLAGMNDWLKRLIGLIPGLASAALAFNSAWRLPDTIIKLVHHLMDNPADIPFAIPVVGANWFAASGPENVFLGVTNNINNVTGFHAGHFGATAFKYSGLIDGLAINGNASIAKAFGPAKPNSDVAKFRHMKAHVSDVNAHLVGHHTADSFRDFLGDLKQTKEIEQDAPELRRNKSEYFAVN